MDDEIGVKRSWFILGFWLIIGIFDFNVGSEFFIFRILGCVYLDGGEYFYVYICGCVYIEVYCV